MEEDQAKLEEIAQRVRLSPVAVPHLDASSIVIHATGNTFVLLFSVVYLLNRTRP
jgi:hypothetical protein